MESAILKAYTSSMRLFYALTFDQKTQAAIAALASPLESGRRVRAEHIHLTLLFLGNCDPADLSNLEAALYTLSNNCLQLTIPTLSSFRRRGSETVWAKVSPVEPLYALHTQLKSALTHTHGLPRNSSFVPHITLAREVHSQPLPAIKTLSISPKTICLLHSHHRRGQLTHTPVATLPLVGENPSLL